jgi:hypothetical protein
MLLVCIVNLGIPDPSYKPKQKMLKSEAKWIFNERWPEK